MIRGVPTELVLAYWMAGWIKVQVVPGVPGVFQARVTGPGRDARLALTQPGFWSHD